MRVLAVFLLILIGVAANDPCQRKNPITRAGSAHSRTVLQESFINERPLDAATRINLFRYESL
jgi:hypothetical protein